MLILALLGGCFGSPRREAPSEQARADASSNARTDESTPASDERAQATTQANSSGSAPDPTSATAPASDAASTTNIVSDTKTDTISDSDTDTDPSPIDSDAPAEPGPDGKSFTVVARLLDLGRHAPPCGIIHAVAVMKFEVLEVEDGRFGRDIVYVYVSCPMYRQRGKPVYRIGDRYRLVLDTRVERRTAGAKFDAFTDVEAPRYRLFRFEPVAAG